MRLPARVGARVAVLLLVGSLAACGQESSTPTSTDEPDDAQETSHGEPQTMAGPPPLSLHRPEGEVDLEAYTWCYHEESGASGEAYAPSLYVTGLDHEPDEATAELELSDGRATATYAMIPSRKDGCPGDGAVSFAGEGPTEPVELPDLGEPPYSYEVHLTMDGRSYTGTGQWPGDLAPPTSNTLGLRWSPPLPAWNGGP